ncbi:hypothetical protein QOZ80_2AG0100180 [Eleusine coracana subsp. coracana]|nr:hypothetical protein QOZ80_2AG0100180 [Eleusine coracana subsp. coracana]
MRGSTAALMATAAAVLMLLVSLTVTDTWTISYEQETLGMFMEWKAKYGVTYEGVGEEECRYALFKNTHRRVVRTNAAGVTSGINGLSGLASEEIFLGRGVQIGEESYEEETRRMFVGWKAKRRHGVRRFNVEFVQGQHSGEAPLALNIFADLTENELDDFKCQMTGNDMSDNNITFPVKRRGDAATHLLRCLTAAKKQGNKCGSCWAFAATAAMESHRAIRTGTLDLLSEQELVDCDVKSHGCKGGRAVNAFNHSVRVWCYQ